MKIKKKPNDMASPCLDHRFPGALTVLLFISRTTLLSADEELEESQRVSLREGAEGSRTPEGDQGEQQDEQQQTGLEGRKMWCHQLPPSWLNLVQPGCCH